MLLCQPYPDSGSAQKVPLLPEAVGVHVEVEASHPTGASQNTATSTELSAHHMPGSARDHLTAKDKFLLSGPQSSALWCRGSLHLPRAGLQAELVSPGHRGQQSHSGVWASSVVSVGNGNKGQTLAAAKSTACLSRWAVGQGVTQQSPGQLEPGQVWPAPRQAP